MALILAIDQGTTGTTVALVNEDRQMVARATREIPQYYPQPGWVEHDPFAIWESVRDTVQALFADGRHSRSELAAIGITNQRETVLVWDNEGIPVHRAIVWQDRRTAEFCTQLAARGYAPLIRQRTGLPLDPYFSAAKIRWLLDQNPSLRTRALAGELRAGTIDTWLVWQLTGSRAHHTDPTNASRTMLYNIHKREWDRELLDAFSLPAQLLPEVRPSAGLFGVTTGLDFLPDGIPITGIAGDQQAALYGQGCVDSGQLKNTYGTGCFILLNTGERKFDSTSGLITTLCCDAQGRPAYALEGAVFIAGAAVQWLRDELRIIQSATETAELAATVPDTGGVYFVPAFVGLGTPYWDMAARGALIGLTRGSNRAQIVRAALESMAYQSAEVLDVMRAESRLPLKELRVDGGACANDFLMQFQADLLRLPVQRPRTIETTALGAALLAGVGAGIWDGGDLAASLPIEHTFTPQMERERARELFTGWKTAVRRVLTVPPA